MNSFVKASALAIGLVVMGSVGAAAATLSIVGGTPNTPIPSSFDLTSTTGLTTGSLVTFFDNSNSTDMPASGLYIGGSATVTYTFLGSEAGFQNWTFDDLIGNNEIIDNKNDALYHNVQVNFTITDPLTPELLPFSFGTSGSSGSTNDPTNAKIAANGDIESPLYMALFQYDPNNVLALFGDGTGDNDFDDLAILISTNNRINAVPLPAPLFLLLSGLLGLGFLGRLKTRTAGRA